MVNMYLLQLYIFLGTSILSVTALAFVVFLTGLKPIGALMSSKLRRSPLILLGRQDGAFVFETGRYKGGVVGTEAGDFFVTPKSTHPFYGRQLALASELTSATLPKKLIENVEELRSQGIYDINEARRAKKDLEAQLKKDKRLKATDTRLLGCISEVVNYLQYSANPAQLADKEAAVLELQKGKDTRNYFLIGGGIAIAILALAFLFYIYKCPTCPACPSYNDLYNSVKAGASAAASGGIAVT